MSYCFLVSFALSLIPFAVYYSKSFKLLDYFICLNTLTPIRQFFHVVFSYLVILVIFTFYDILTTTHDKEWLQFKEEIGLCFILIFEVIVMVISPLLCVYYRKMDNNTYHCSVKDEIINYKSLCVYYVVVILLNIRNYCFGNFYTDSKVIGTNYGFSNNVPEGLAIYSKLDQRVYQCIYFNFGLLMVIGKFIGFTYLPFGMSKFVSEYIFISNDNNTDIDITKLKNKTNSSNDNSNDNNEAIELYPCDEDNRHLTESNENQSKKIITSEDDTEFKDFIRFLFGIASFVLIVFIIYTKISIIYVKLFYNICGVDCGLLAYRYDEIISLETILNQVSQYSNEFIKWDYFAFAYLLLFRMLTLIHSMRIKGISFLWIIYTKPNRDMTPYHLIHFLTNILFASIVLIYDFTYLLPDYMRFNSLDPICDYSLIQKSYCGVSFFGLLFIKVSMNYHSFMYWDIIASLIFITNSIIWMYRLILNPGMAHIAAIVNHST